MNNPDKFLLPRKSAFTQKQDRPLVRTTRETYDVLAQWAVESGYSLSKVLSLAVEFANNRIEFFDEDEP